MTHSCPTCGAPASGRFCSQCGTSLVQALECAGCGNRIPEGGAFCNMCGRPVVAGRPTTSEPPVVKAVSPSAPGSNAGTNLPWIITGVSLLVLAGVFIIPRFGAPETPQSAPFVAAAPGDPAAIDLSSMTPREAADRLYNRVMEGVSVGDSVQARTFAPMAIAAYDRVDSLDADGLYHVAALHLVDGNAEAARETADRILAVTPEHLFGLFVAAQAEALIGNSEQAKVLYQRFLDNYSLELAATRQEYNDHAALLPVMRQEAEAWGE